MGRAWCGFGALILTLGCQRTTPPVEAAGDEPPRWAVPAAIPPASSSTRLSAEAPDTSHARFTRHLHDLRRRGRVAPDFSVAIAPPFVVIGDGAPSEVRAWAENTVSWAVRRLKQEYFAEDPRDVLEIWLFKDAGSYEHHATSLFGSQPGTPFGYYSRDARALVMNISTGGGTLVHEIVHPYIEANFPDCPAWFNEGLGSLYEQSAERDGRIVGLTNWRLAGLQQAIRARGLPSFRALTSTTTHEFYELDPGTNYAQARYLLYYLQERGLLAPYYREFTRHVAEDASGYRSLERVLEERDMAAFQKHWERFVLDLTFP
ncbi:MAG TPA: hypothetical protein VI197_31260 [Polyangiaceae bacterium]